MVQIIIPIQWNYRERLLEHHIHQLYQQTCRLLAIGRSHRGPPPLRLPSTGQEQEQDVIGNIAWLFKSHGRIFEFLHRRSYTAASSTQGCECKICTCSVNVKYWAMCLVHFVEPNHFWPSPCVNSEVLWRLRLVDRFYYGNKSPVFLLWPYFGWVSVREPLILGS